MAATTCRGHAAHGAVMTPPPPPPPPQPQLFELQLGAGGNGSAGTKATAPLVLSRRHLGICTEGLGSESSESSGDVDVSDDYTDKDVVAHALPCKRQHYRPDDSNDDNGQTTVPLQAWTRTGRAFPPPISVIGAGGKPWLYLRAHRGDGRLVLREIRIPSRELLHACREDGRFKLHFAHPEEQDEDEQPADDPDLTDAPIDAAKAITGERIE
ncbi:hypothetical protein GUJ93_ZPchr0006g40754 [Zizania palustris]|uniref:FAF domain-containing protein n=1 Tax=Zizania palustris TaxID=103762 RepID=A0A8J5VHI4_ZIZPA|nr:hypothetical protein GUJ93_ZPchr0006g40754 [Zizania palustris]